MSKSFTEEDVQLVADALGGAVLPLAAHYEDSARAVLAALAEAGRLLPAGGEVLEQWTYAEVDRTGSLEPVHWDHVFDCRADAEAHFAFLQMQASGRTWDGVRIARRVKVAGPWVEEDGTKEERRA